MVELTPVGAKGVLLGEARPKKTSTEFDRSVRFLLRQGFSIRHLRAASLQAKRRGTNAATELLATGAITHDAYYRSLAKALGVRFCVRQDVTAVLDLQTPTMRASQTFARLADGTLVVLVVPRTNGIAKLATLFSRAGLKRRVAICCPQTMRSLLVRQYEKAVVDKVCTELRTEHASLSSHAGPAFAHGFTLSILIATMAGSLVLAPSLSATILHAFVALFFFACVVLRAAAALSHKPKPYTKIEKVTLAQLPTYTVLVALRDEANIVPGLVRNLRSIRWPRSKLQIILACEADDRETIVAIESQNLDPCFELITVPVHEPRTKPKALSYALKFVNGELLTIYDAEDHPHPMQLVEAYQKFQRSDACVACLQAPLVTTNPTRSTISALFHLEYAGLFRALMPWLERVGAPLLLGGTSNHFKTDAVRAVGSWDPYNVTEDADIGLRLWRQGYRTEMITRPTLEPAPHTLGVWLRQRTRWFKGWLQTAFVHTRHPMLLVSELGGRAALITLLLLIGTIVSAIFHPVLLASAIISLSRLLTSDDPSLAAKVIAWIDWSTILLSYTAFAALCWCGTNRAQRKQVGWRILLIPAYWVGFSIAAWRAVVQMFKDPFLWEKTPH
ncbi:MAG: glycosyltransferase family 2 protein [Pseudomonadota bacterium]